MNGYKEIQENQQPSHMKQPKNLQWYETETQNSTTEPDRETTRNHKKDKNATTDADGYKEIRGIQQRSQIRKITLENTKSYM